MVGWVYSEVLKLVSVERMLLCMFVKAFDII